MTSPQEHEPDIPLPPQTQRAIGLVEARELLGESISYVSDEELQRVIDSFYLIATIAYDREDLNEPEDERISS